MKHKQRSLGREIISWVSTILVALVVAMVLKSFAFELVRVDGESMLDTLHDGNIMLVTKFDYGSFWLSLPWQDAETQEQASRLTWGDDIQRFDVVVARYPGSGTTNFVKRIIGLPGDSVELKDGYVYINGNRYEEPHVADRYRTFDSSIMCRKQAMRYLLLQLWSMMICLIYKFLMAHRIGLGLGMIWRRI